MNINRALMFLGVALLSCGVRAEIVNMTCTSSNGPYHLSVSTPPTTKVPMVFFNDKPPEDFGRYVWTIDSVKIASSEITFATNLKNTEDGTVVRIFYTISRLTGRLSMMGFVNGVANQNNEPPQQCEPRKANKF